MKQIKVNEKCNGCGLCIMSCSYLQENADGNAQPIQGKAVKEADLNEVMKTVNSCPEGALSIVETGSASQSGKNGVNEVISDLKKKCASLSVKKVNRAAVKFKIDVDAFPLMYSGKERRSIYSSESAARSAAREEFSRLYYSESAYRPMLKNVFVSYKVNVLKPYYTCEDVPESEYFRYNETVRGFLADAYAEVSDLIGENKVPESWKEFSVYLSEKDFSIESLKMFDERSTSSGIIAAFRDSSYTNLSDYVSDMDFDCDEEYVGEGLFGHSKYKKMWYFTGFNSAAKDFIKDLTWAVNYMSTEIEEGAVNSVNSAIKAFEALIKKSFNSKIDELTKYTR